MRAVSALGGLMTAVFDVLSRPLQGLSPLWALTLISLATGVLLVWLYGRISNQRAIRQVRERIRGNLLGIYVYRHELGVMLGLQGRIVKDAIASMRFVLVPVLVVLVPIVLILAQLNLRFGVRPLLVGESVVVKANVRSPAALEEPIELTAASGAQVETPAVRMPSSREIAWRVRATEPGRHVMSVRVGNEVVEKLLVAGTPWTSVPQRRTGQSALDVLLYPGEAPIPADFRIESVEISYPALPLRLLGANLDWLILFFLLSTAFGYLFKGVLGVEL